MSSQDWSFCTAPMMDWTDRHCRYIWRLMSRSARLYTEMVTTGALIHGDRSRFLTYNVEEHPLALQLGGSEPADLARCAAWAEAQGYDEVNLNCGCPSDRVQNGAFGACLMSDPTRVRDCVSAMRDACSLPVTVKHRIGIDHMEAMGSSATLSPPWQRAAATCLSCTRGKPGCRDYRRKRTAKYRR